MPLLGSCHIPQAQGNQLDPRMQASSTPGDLLLKSSSLPPSPKPESAWDSSLALDPPAPSPFTGASEEQERFPLVP